MIWLTIWCASWEAVVQVKMLTKTLGALAVLAIAGCGGTADDVAITTTSLTAETSTTTATTASTLPEEPTTTTTVPPSTPVVSFDYTDAEGWHYTGTIDWFLEHAHTFDLDIASSPPGRARVAVEWTGEEDPFPDDGGPDFFPDNPGRPNGPALTVDCCELFYGAPPEDVLGRIDRVDSSGTCAPDIIQPPEILPTLTTVEVPGESDLGAYVLSCEPRGYDGSSSAFGGSNDDEFDESDAQAIVDAAGPPPVGWGFSLNRQFTCQAIVTFDGEIVLDDPSFWRETCGSATFELDRAP